MDFVKAQGLTMDADGFINGPFTYLLPGGRTSSEPQPGWAAKYILANNFTSIVGELQLPTGSRSRLKIAIARLALAGMHGLHERAQYAAGRCAPQNLAISRVPAANLQHCVLAHAASARRHPRHAACMLAVLSSHISNTVHVVLCRRRLQWRLPIRTHGNAQVCSKAAVLHH